MTRFKFVTIPYSSGESIGQLVSWLLRVRLIAVTIPYSSGESIGQFRTPGCPISPM